MENKYTLYKRRKYMKMMEQDIENHLRALSTNASRQLHILGLQRSAATMNGTKVAVLKQANQIGLSGLLKGRDSGRLESQIGLVILSNLSHETLEGHATNKKLGRLLVATDFAKSNGACTRNQPTNKTEKG
eukprot:TRINITY_DN1129_c0_g1_i1.p1 TRINITY_DN1129_c0_g1~~TRINITY_DN1129_c0_g1_i1.p1  ORF type:complete len:131 (+),score=17.24 TRINITY_DN1129_c0_g1_i1:15-407(+)